MWREREARNVWEICLVPSLLNTTSDLSFMIGLTTSVLRFSAFSDMRWTISLKGSMVKWRIQVSASKPWKPRTLKLSWNCSWLKIFERDKINIRLISLYSWFLSWEDLALMRLTMMFLLSLFDEPPVPVVVFVLEFVVCFDFWSFGCLYSASLNFHISRMKRYHDRLWEKRSLSFLRCRQRVSEEDYVGQVLVLGNHVCWLFVWIDRVDMYWYLDGFKVDVKYSTNAVLKTSNLVGQRCAQRPMRLKEI